MTGYTIYNGKPHYWRRGVAKRFRETIDPNFTDSEVTSVLNKMRFPIVSYVEKSGDKMKVYGLYDSNLIESWIKNRKSEILDKLRERREYDAKVAAMKIQQMGKKQKTEFDNRSMDEIQAEWEKKDQERKKRYEEMMRRKLEAEMKERDEKERENPEENMDKVSDELLRNDDVYYEGKQEENNNKLNEEESDDLDKEIKRWYDRDNSLMMAFDQFKKMIYHFVNYSRDVHDNITDVDVKEETTDFGKTWHVNSPDGSFRFALYMYDDDPKTAYLSNVFVDEKMRGNGIGNTILDKADEMARKIGAETLCLKVKRDSFVHQWYRRKGYVDFQPDNDDKDHIWMKKKL